MPELRPIAIAFTLNGHATTIETSPMATLADCLRDTLKLTGTKTGCDAGDCGACTVLLDGQSVCACLVPMGQAGGAHIETIESQRRHPLSRQLQQAFLAHGAAQCGICTPGMLMAAQGLLIANAAPSRGEVEDALGGVLCRCTGYQKIIEAVLDVGQPENPVELPVKVGERLARLDGQAKISGTEIFGADFAPAGALWMRVIRAPYAHATFTLGNIAAFVTSHAGLAALLGA